MSPVGRVHSVHGVHCVHSVHWPALRPRTPTGCRTVSSASRVAGWAPGLRPRRLGPVAIGNAGIQERTGAEEGFTTETRRAQRSHGEEQNGSWASDPDASWASPCNLRVLRASVVNSVRLLGFSHNRSLILPADSPPLKGMRACKSVIAPKRNFPLDNGKERGVESRTLPTKTFNGGRDIPNHSPESADAC